MKSSLRVGMIGTGGISQNVHFPGWAKVKEAKVVAACDVNRERAEEAARKFDVPAVYTDFHEMLEREDLDAVDITTPNKLHTPAVLAALAKGCYVICEKPLATTVKEVDQIIAASKKAKRWVMTAQNQRYSGMARALKKFLEKDGMGTPYHARVHALRRNLLPSWGVFTDMKMSGGGPCMDIGVHALDCCLWLMGHPQPVSVLGQSGVYHAFDHQIPGAWGEWDRKKYSVEDFATGFVRFSNGATLVLESSWLSHMKPSEELNFFIFGTKASVAWPSGEVFSAENRVMTDRTLKSLGEEPSHHLEIADFARAVLQGKGSPVPLDQTRKVIQILEGIMRSGKEKREIRYS